MQFWKVVDFAQNTTRGFETHDNCSYFTTHIHVTGLLHQPRREKKVWQIIDEDGNPLVLLGNDYGNLENSPFQEGFARVTNKNGRWVFIDKTGRDVALAVRYDEVTHLSEGLAWVRTTGRDVALAARYDEVAS